MFLFIFFFYRSPSGGDLDRINLLKSIYFLEMLLQNKETHS